jgi:hypothetical protein
MDELDILIREFTPKEGDWRPLDLLFDRVFTAKDPRKYYQSIFILFDRFPADDGSGVFWSALHGMEFVGDYENLLLMHHRKSPSEMTEILLRRILKSGQTHIGEVEISVLIGK